MKRLYDRRLLPASGFELLQPCRLRRRGIHVVAYEKNLDQGKGTGTVSAAQSKFSEGGGNSGGACRRDWGKSRGSLSGGDWSADGTSVFMPSVTSKHTQVILRVDEAGKAEVVLEGDANTMFWWMLQSPDGRYGMLEAKVPGDNNAWMVKNL